jgi:hypothetical protein
MSTKLTALKIAYSNLSYEERKDFQKFIKEFEESTFSERDVLNENFRKSLGPINSASCPYCGK